MTGFHAVAQRFQTVWRDRFSAFAKVAIRALLPFTVEPRDVAGLRWIPESVPSSKRGCGMPNFLNWLSWNA